MDKTVLSYIAAFVDGEGTIGIRKYPQRKACHTVEYAAHITITNTNKAVLEWIKEQLGFGCIVKRPDKRPNHRMCYQWTVTYNQAVKTLELILPYLQIKKTHAELALQCEAIRHMERSRRGKPKPSYVVDKQLALKEAIRILNAA